eukprot:443265_1
MGSDISSTRIFDCDDNDIIKSDYLEKESRHKKEWRARYTVLALSKKMHYKSMYTFHDTNFENATEAIIGVDEYQPIQNNQYFTLTQNDKNMFHFKCRNSKECKEWVDAIKSSNIKRFDDKKMNKLSELDDPHSNNLVANKPFIVTDEPIISINNNANTLQKTDIESIDNIIKILKQYKSILNDKNMNDLILKYFEQNKVETIFIDCDNIFKNSLNDNSPNVNYENFQQIYNMISKEIKCDVNDCKQCNQNNVDDLNEEKNNNINEIELNIKFYVELINNIHTFFLHSNINTENMDIEKFIIDIDVKIKHFNAYIMETRDLVSKIRGKLVQNIIQNASQI